MNVVDPLLIQASTAILLGLFFPEKWLTQLGLNGPTLVIWGAFTGAIGFILSVVLVR